MKTYACVAIYQKMFFVTAENDSKAYIKAEDVIPTLEIGEEQFSNWHIKPVEVSSGN